MNVTEVYEKRPDRPQRRINRIEYSSKFESMPWTKKVNMENGENQLRAAREIRDGWVKSGSRPFCEYEIYQNGELVRG